MCKVFYYNIFLELCFVFMQKTLSLQKIRMMKTTELTSQQIERFIKKITHKFPSTDEASVMTDIHLRVTQDSGEMMAFDDDDQEITRCVIEEWIENKDEQFYQTVTTILRKELTTHQADVESMSILKPYSFVLENDDKENVAELYVVDDETVIIGGDLMEGLDEDLDKFLDDLLN